MGNTKSKCNCAVSITKELQTNHNYQPLPRNVPIASRVEAVKEKLYTTQEYGNLRPSDLNRIAADLTDIERFKSRFIIPHRGSEGQEPSVSATAITDKVPIKLLFAQPTELDHGTVVRADSIVRQLEIFCSFGINSDAGLLIGDQYFKWTPNSLVIPKGMKTCDESHGATCSLVPKGSLVPTRGPADETTQLLSIENEQLTYLGETNQLDQFLGVASTYNGECFYHPLARNSKIFVRDALRGLKLENKIPPLLVIFNNYYKKIKEQALGIRCEFTNHKELNEYTKRTDHTIILQKKENVEYLFFLCICFHVQLAADSSAAVSQQHAGIRTCSEPDCCLPFLCSNLTSISGSIFNEFWQSFTVMITANKYK